MRRALGGFVRTIAVLIIGMGSITANAVTSAPTAPGWSLTGDYTVSYVNYNCSWSSPSCFSQYLEEKLEPSGSWAAVAGGTPEYMTFSGKPAGTYSYRLVRLLKPYYTPDRSAPITVDVGARPLPFSEDQGYATRHGDLDGDGDIDLYVKRVAGTSWKLPMAEFVLRRTSSGGFAVETAVSTATRNIVNGWGISSTLPRLVDFNADGYQDLLVTGLSAVNAGPDDVVVFASDGPGAPPPSARVMDAAIRKFALDTTSYLADPSYFASAYQFLCTLQYGTVPGWRRDIDAGWYFHSLPIAYVSCGYHANPAFSPTAVAMGASLKSILDTARYQLGSSAANTVGSQFQQLFGTAYMGSTSTSLVAADILMTQYPEETRRALRALAGVIQLGLWARGMLGPSPIPLPTGPHSYGPIEAVICHVSNPYCTQASVFTNVLRFPVLGRQLSPSQGCTEIPRSICGTPVQNGDRSLVEIEELATDHDDVGPVTHTVIPGSYTLINTTEPGHAFHPGTVTRTVVVGIDGYVKVVTTGSGTGPLPEMNELVGPRVFKAIDETIKSRVP